MPRPRKCRKVCRLPVSNEFTPSASCAEWVVLTVDEYEAIRLLDYENFSQEETAVYMQIARSTVQTIYNGARKKIAKTLVTGAGLRIEGGEYTLCSGEEPFCSCGGCTEHKKMRCGE